MGRAVTFFGAADIPHCSGMVRFGKSDNVKVGGLGVSRQFDINTPHLKPAGVFCVPHIASISGHRTMSQLFRYAHFKESI